MLNALKNKMNCKKAIKMIAMKANIVNEMNEKLPTFLKGKDDNNIAEIVRFFDYISKFHDKNPFQEIINFCEKKQLTHESFYEPIRVLSLHFKNAGRCTSGWNRTEKGETVTPDKVYLGDVFGLWTFSAQYWLERENTLKQEEHMAASGNPDKIVSVWDVINDYQAKKFIHSHVKPMIEYTNQLAKVA